LQRHNGMAFSTFDMDNDNWEDRNCAEYHHGAWWYNACQYSNLNGEYIMGGMFTGRGINWFHWQYNELSLMTTSMKLRNC